MRSESARAAAFLGDHAEDVIGWVLASDEPYAAWVIHAHVLEGPGSAGAAAAAHDRVIADERVRELMHTLPSWGDGDAGPSGHHGPAYLPNRLNLLADMGAGAGDSEHVERLLDSLLAHQDRSGRFLALRSRPGKAEPEWGSMLCDTNVITDVLLRFGRGSDARVLKALEHIKRDSTRTAQGRAWRCVPDRASLWRGPGRRADACPQVTLEGLRTLSHLEPELRPSWTTDAARTSLGMWRRRTSERPYLFGHGYQFKSVKWPDFWYDALWVVETLGRYPALWKGPEAQEQDIEALCELAACLIAYNIDPDGRVTPRRTYRGFELYSFGQKKQPSPFATARVLAALARVSELAPRIARVDVAELPGSVGGSGSPMLPRSGSLPRTALAACPGPAPPPSVSAARATAHVLVRQHLASSRDGASVESISADLVGLHATSQTSPYASLFARLPGFARDDLDVALYDRRSLVRWRCMRGTVFVIPTELLPVVFAATSFPVIRHARRFAEFRGVDGATYSAVVPRILRTLDEGALTSSQIRERLGADGGPDVAATVNLMCTEGLLLRDRPVGTWTDRRTTFVPLSEALPDVRLDSVRTDDAVRTLVRAYVRGFGPVSDQDVSWWLGIGKQRVRHAFDQLEGELVEVTLEGASEPHMVHAADLDDLSSVDLIDEPHVALLPALDPLTMGYANRGRLVADAHCPWTFDMSRNMPATVLVNGRVAGVWDATPRETPGILVHLFEHAGRDMAEAVEARAAEMGAFWFDESVPVEFVRSMIALVDRPPGSFAHPLRP